MKKNKKYHIEFDISFKRNPYKGIFIAVEGVDASGKSTQAKRLIKEFEAAGRKVVMRHPFEGKLGQFIRTILSGEVKLPAVSLQYLISANRQVQQKDIIRDLKKGTDVIIDRYIWSAVAYGILDKKGVNFGDTAQWLLIEQSILSMYNQFMMPDHTFFLDIPAKTACKRLSKMEKKKEIYESDDKTKKIVNIYKFITDTYPDEFTMIDGELSIDKLTKEIMKVLKKDEKFKT